MENLERFKEICSNLLDWLGWWGILVMGGMLILNIICFYRIKNGFKLGLICYGPLLISIFLCLFNLSFIHKPTIIFLIVVWLVLIIYPILEILRSVTKKLYNDLVYNEERRFYPAGLRYEYLHLPTEEELLALNLSREDGEFVFVKRGGFVGAYITKSVHSNRYFLNMASPIMKEKKLTADVRKENGLWKGNYYCGEPPTRTVMLNENDEYFTLLNELFNDAEDLLSQINNSSVIAAVCGVGVIILGLIFYCLFWL